MIQVKVDVPYSKLPERSVCKHLIKTKLEGPSQSQARNQSGSQIMYALINVPILQ